MKARWGFIALFVAAVFAVPLASAWAQGAPGGETPTEGSAPLGGTINCETAPTLDPPEGEPGTVVTVTATFQGNCDEFDGSQFQHTCTGEVTADGIEGFSFPMEFDNQAKPAVLTGEFTAPSIPPDPPVVDAIEPLTVSVTCEFSTVSSPSEATEGTNPGQTTYVYPEATFNTIESADHDDDQPTLVDAGGAENPPPTTTPGVVAASPTFTG